LGSKYRKGEFLGVIKKRLLQVQLIVSFVGFSWLAMQAVHELGHVITARLSGGEVLKVALHPLIVSRTDLGYDPHPLAVVWGGPIFGSMLPLLASALATWFRVPGSYLFRFFAGFCLVSNGLYIGIGRFLAEGADPWVMTENGSPRWVLVAFGLTAFTLGLYLWHRQGQHFGLGDAKGNVSTEAAFISTALLLTLLAAELIYNVK
jgi:hypothetical protein